MQEYCSERQHRIYVFIRMRESYTAMRLLYTFGKTRFFQDVANLPTANLM